MLQKRGSVHMDLLSGRIANVHGWTMAFGRASTRQLDLSLVVL